MPARHPFHPLPLLRLALECSQDGSINRFTAGAILRHVWQGGHDALDPARLDALRAALAEQLRGDPEQAAKKLLSAMLAAGEIVEVRVESWKTPHLMLGSDVALLNELSAGRVPAAWAPLDTTTTEEVVFLAPLDHVSARGRAKVVFGFEYIWEVYKPEHLRQFGYYVLPILWGDQLVARFDSKFDRTTNTYVILGLWLEDDTLGQNEAFAEALARGFARFVTFLGARALDAAAIREPLLRQRIVTLTTSEIT
jgi:uncharacterized protein YcaQ